MDRRHGQARLGEGQSFDKLLQVGGKVSLSLVATFFARQSGVFD
jgi:hypothetical protein